MNFLVTITAPKEVCLKILSLFGNITPATIAIHETYFYIHTDPSTD